MKQLFKIAFVQNRFNLTPLLSQAFRFSKTPLFFRDKHGKQIKVHANLGDNLLEVAKKNKIPIEGACEGQCACSTCHVILKDKFYNSLE